MPRDFVAVDIARIRGQNARRRAMSQPDVYTVPTLKPNSVLFIPAGKMNGKPASCYSCSRYNQNRSCMLLGPHIPVKKFIYPPEPVPADSKAIEFWPCCGEFSPGEPNYGPEEFCDTFDDPGELALGWINVKKIGQEYGGATCGGNDATGEQTADECDFYITEEADARETKTGWCRVLQRDVENGAVCTAWQDDDWVPYEMGSNILRELDSDATGTK